jgi:branched-chain amino acid transport system substrate-binding protein
VNIRRLTVIALISAFALSLGCSQDLKIGAVISKTGSVAPYGEQVEKGIRLAWEEINAGGGIKGGQVELIFKDDSTNSDVGLRVAQELIEQDGVGVIIGAISSHVTLRIAEHCEEKGVVLLSPSSSASQISQAGDYIFRNYPSDILEGTAMAEFAKDLGLERVVIFALDTEFGTGLSDIFTGKYESKFRKVVKVFSVQGDSAAGLTEMVAEAKSLDPDGIYLVTYVDELVTLLGQIQEAEIGATLLGTSSVPQDVARLAGEAANMLVYPQPNFDPNSKDPAVASFVQAFQAKYGELPEIYAAHGYDALKLIKWSVEEMNSTHPSQIKLGLSSVSDFQGAAGRTSFDENGDVVRYPRLFVISDGKAVAYEEFKEQGGSILKPGQG